MKKRMDRYIQRALQAFADWYVTESPEWIGKERDCVNIFATRFLMAGIEEGAAIQHREQIRIEGGVKQPTGYPKEAATKDVVIWKDQFQTAWDSNWKPVNTPRAIIEWKNKRSGRHREDFDPHDKAWMEAFTRENPKAVGFLVSTHATQQHRSCSWAMVRSGIVGKAQIIN